MNPRRRSSSKTKPMQLSSLKAWNTTLDKLRRARKLLVQSGWKTLGSDRTDAVTLTSVMDAAVDELLREIEP